MNDKDNKDIPVLDYEFLQSSCVDASEESISTFSSSKESSSNEATSCKKNNLMAVDKKKSRRQYVPSRYLQAAKTYGTSKNSSESSNGSSTEKGLLGLNSSNLKRAESSMILKAEGGKPYAKGFQGSTLSVCSGSRVSLSDQISLQSQAKWKPMSCMLSFAETPLKPGDSSQRLFSSTILEGVHPPDCHGPNMPCTPLLQDISEIKPSDAYNFSTLHRRISALDLGNEYLQYLMWAHLDVSSHEAYSKQQEEGKRQLHFLVQKLNQKKQESKEAEAELGLLKTYEIVTQRHATLKACLECLSGESEPCLKALSSLQNQLKMTLHQVKIKNLYIPSDHVAYRAKMNDQLEEMFTLLNSINVQLEPLQKLVEESKEIADYLLSLLKNFKSLQPDLLRCIELSMTDVSLKVSREQLKLQQHFAEASREYLNNFLSEE